eukprot:scaffold26361_cov54-Phaeocystis_antarctica.AAC.2
MRCPSCSNPDPNPHLSPSPLRSPLTFHPNPNPKPNPNPDPNPHSNLNPNPNPNPDPAPGAAPRALARDRRPREAGQAGHDGAAGPCSSRRVLLIVGQAGHDGATGPWPYHATPYCHAALPPDPALSSLLLRTGQGPRRLAQAVAHGQPAQGPPVARDRLQYVHPVIHRHRHRPRPAGVSREP